MSQFLTSYFARTRLERELADQDARQLLDIGLVRAEDGSLRLAEDPSQAAIPAASRDREGAFPQLFRSWSLPAGLGLSFFSRR